jgi:hypothetical protein
MYEDYRIGNLGNFLLELKSMFGKPNGKRNYSRFRGNEMEGVQ